MNDNESPAEFITWNESKYNTQTNDQYETLDNLRKKNEDKLKRLMRPLNLNQNKSMKHSTHESAHPSHLNDSEHNFSQNARVKYKPPKSKSKRRNQNVLAYSLLDKSLDNTITLLENARRQNHEQRGVSNNSKGDLFR